MGGTALDAGYVSRQAAEFARLFVEELDSFNRRLRDEGFILDEEGAQIPLDRPDRRPIEFQVAFASSIARLYTTSGVIITRPTEDREA